MRWQQLHVSDFLLQTYFLSSFFCLIFSLSLSLPPPLRWLFGKTVCLIYAFCGVLFGLCSLTTLTLLSMVCFVKVCCPHYGKSSKSRSPAVSAEMTQDSKGDPLKWSIVDLLMEGNQKAKKIPL